MFTRQKPLPTTLTSSRYVIVNKQYLESELQADEFIEGKLSSERRYRCSKRNSDDGQHARPRMRPLTEHS